MLDNHVHFSEKVLTFRDVNLKILGRLLPFLQEPFSDELLIDLLDLVAISLETFMTPVLDFFHRGEATTWCLCSFDVELNQFELEDSVANIHNFEIY